MRSDFMKKNFFPLIAMVLGILIVLYGIFGGGGNLIMFFDVASLLIVIVGSFFALGIIYQLKERLDVYETN